MRGQQCLLVHCLSTTCLLLLHHHLVSHLGIKSLLVNKSRCLIIGRANELNDGWVLIPWHLLDTNNVVLVRVSGTRSFLLALHHLSLSLPLDVVSNGDVIELMSGFDCCRVEMLLREQQVLLLRHNGVLSISCDELLPILEPGLCSRLMVGLVDLISELIRCRILNSATLNK